MEGGLFQGAGSGSELDHRLRRELREKSALLENKIKLLRVKEVEFRKVTIIKDRASKEVLLY